MLEIRRSKDRGYFDHGWLRTFHTFSFGDYHDPQFEGFRSLRVINEDTIAPGQGFGTHSHRDMEIISYVVEGALAHKDSLGNGSTILPGEVQFMSAGSGVSHSEFNHSKDQASHFLQIWIKPKTKGTTPRYEQKMYSIEAKKDRLALVASEDGRDGSIRIGQDADLYASILNTGKSIELQPTTNRGLWLQVIRGQLQVSNESLTAGDGAKVNEVTPLKISALLESEFLLFDLG